MWIHEHQNWPKFTWHAKTLASRLTDIRYHQGRLLGRMEGLGFALKREASLSTLTNDVVKSSAIEGENLNPEEVRSSIARRLGVDIAGLIPASRNANSITISLKLDNALHLILLIGCHGFWIALGGVCQHRCPNVLGTINQL